MTGQTFEAYAQKTFLPYVKTFLRSAERVDVVWDVYIKKSLKQFARGKRGKGKKQRRRVVASVPVPGNWQEFLRVDDNKTELFGFLAQYLVQLHVQDKVVITAKGENALSNNPLINISDLGPCTHEEADTRMILHIAHARRNGYHNILIRTVDTDVVVLAIAARQQLGEGELRLLFGTGRNSCYISVNTIADRIGETWSPLFHALMGCDTVSAFVGKGKKTAWESWKAYPDIATTFVSLVDNPFSLDENQEVHMQKIERFIVIMYERASSLVSVNEARRHLFTKKGRDIQAIPPTYAALYQHVRRAVLQGGHCWGQALAVSPTLPSPVDWGWKIQANTNHFGLVYLKLRNLLVN